MLVVRGNEPNLKRLNQLKELYNKEFTAVTIGNFDGVHLGHQSILEQLTSIACNHNLLKVVITFEPPPMEYFKKLAGESLIHNRITTLADKLRLLKQHQIDLVWVMNFNSLTANTSANDFLENIFTILNFRFILVGKDFKFGKKRQGDIYLLEKYCKKNKVILDNIPDFEIKKNRVSSSHIRHLLSNQNGLNLIKLHLGRYYGFTGLVVEGQQKGRFLGFPTVNIHVKSRQILLSQGVYAVNIYHNNKKYNAMANWGVRPTIANKLDLVLEAHIFEFDQNIYFQKVYIEFITKIRDEQKFDSVDSLVKQLVQDRMTVMEFFD